MGRGEPSSMTQSGRGDEVPTMDGRVDDLNRVVELLVRKMEETFECSMDYSPRSIAYMDAVLAEVHNHRRGLTPSLFLAIGGYVGETLVRAFDGEWVEEDGNLAVRLPGGAHERTLEIFDWVKQAYANPHEDNIGQRLDAVLGDGLGPGPGAQA